tara:strand:- start:2027 stop:2203 length:177 start_codon:yes stop_codon:yes gene_type:complete
VQLDHKVIKVNRELLVLKDLQDHRVVKENPVKKVLLVLVDHKETKVLQVLEGIKVRKV